MALRRGPQLDDVHRLARVHVHVEADAIRHHHAVRRDVAQALRRHRFVELGGPVHDLAPVRERARLLDRGRLRVAVSRAERLPFERQQPMPLQIAKRPVVGQHVEPVGGALERAARPVTTVRALPDVGAKQRDPIVGRQTDGRSP